MFGDTQGKKKHNLCLCMCVCVYNIICSLSGHLSWCGLMHAGWQTAACVLHRLPPSLLTLVAKQPWIEMGSQRGGLIIISFRAFSQISRGSNGVKNPFVGSVAWQQGTVSLETADITQQCVCVCVMYVCLCLCVSLHMECFAMVFL